MKVFFYNNVLVSPINSNTVITQKGEIIEKVDVSTLKKASLYSSGIYNEKFIQAAVGGLRRPPIHNGKLLAYDGFDAVAFVEPVSRGIVKFAIGLPSEAFGPGAEKLNDMKINKDKSKDYDKDKPKGKKMVEEIDELEKLGDGKELSPEKEDTGPEELKLSDQQSLSGVKRLVLEWTSGIDNISIEDIKENFGEDKFLPEPDTIRLTTENETVVRKKSRPGSSAVRAEIDSSLIKKSYYGLTPTMSSSCPKCQSKLFIDWEVQRKEGKTVVKCSNPKCDYEALYEGSLENEGLAGQKRVETEV